MAAIHFHHNCDCIDKKNRQLGISPFGNTGYKFNESCITSNKTEAYN